ncbi:anti-sigma factor family protein [Actinomadura sp. 9N407]|uniref:anti-sigma factor family protein n=1 Tax=Actinomadura sp. 9N407 TaxID=3375154 RepID=UPI0037B77111
MNPAHYDYDTLADLAEGILEDDQAASVSEHLESCAECRDRSADLADVSRILAEAPVPSMPAELAARIDSAIAAESLSTATVVNLEQRRGRRHWRILSAAAATVIVLGGGGMVGKMALDGNEHQASNSPPITDNQDNGPPGGAEPSGSAKMAPGEAAKAGFQVSSSGTDYGTATLEKQVNGTIDRTGELRATPGPPDARLAGCVDRVTTGRAPALVDTATYEGGPATVIAAKATGQNRLDVWIVGPDCSAEDTQVRKHTTITRHT